MGVFGIILCERKSREKFNTEAMKMVGCSEISQSHGAEVQVGQFLILFDDSQEPNEFELIHIQNRSVHLRDKTIIIYMFCINKIRIQPYLR